MARSYTVSAKVREANKARAQKPRGKWAGTKEREELEDAKQILRSALSAGAKLVSDIIKDETAPAEIRLQAFKIAADRGGLPQMTQQDVSVSATNGREVWMGGLGWPEVTGGVEEPSAASRDDRSDDQPSIQ